jgi:segregation and condensation protein B
MASSLASKIESILFISGRPLTHKQLADVTDASAAEVAAAVTELAEQYAAPERGVLLQQAGNTVQLATSGDNAALVQEFIKEETQGELSRAALETLTVIAYRGPVSRADIEQIRGVNCAIMLRTLLMRGLVVSTQATPKQQPNYEVTLDFLQFLGLRAVTELPDYEKLNSSEALQHVLEQPTGAATAPRA